MDDERRKILRNYSITFLLFSIIIFFLGFMGIFSANGDSNYNSPRGLTDIAYGISLVLIGCILLFGSILFLVKANELD